MSTFLVQGNTGSVYAYLSSFNGSPVTGLTYTDVAVDLKKYGASVFSSKVLYSFGIASATIGSGVDGTVSLSVPGTIGNSWSVEVVPALAPQALSVLVVGTAVTVNLSDVSANNTATLVAAAISAAAPSITTTASGTGASSLTAAEGPTFLAGGFDSNFTEVGNGYYQLVLNTTDTDTLGNMAVRFSSAFTRTTIETVTVAATVPSPVPTGIGTPETTDLFGYLMEVDGSPVAGASVKVYPLGSPLIVHPVNEGIAISTSVVVVVTDSTGFFSFAAITGSQIDVIISSVNYRRTLTVPATSMNLFDIP